MLFEWDEISEYSNRESISHNNRIQLYDCNTKQFTTVTKDIFYVFDAAWSPEDTEVLYAGTDMLSGQVVFKVASSDGSTQQLLLTIGENPLEQPSSIADIDELVWLKE
jgi:WD40 repeat protein